MAIVYEHVRNDTNEVFYVGIGKTEHRAYSKNKRNQHWKNIAKKVGYTINIIHKDIDWNKACQIEKSLILKYGRINLGLGNLVNMTDGGDGVFGLVHSEESRHKISEASKGRTHSDEAKQKISEASKGRTHSDEAKQKMSGAIRNKKGAKGYYYHKSRNMHVAQIKFLGQKRIYLGSFKTEEEAAKAYQDAKLIYHS